MPRMQMIAAASLLAGCTTVAPPPPDDPLAALATAQVRACPAERIQEGAFAGGETETSGVTASDLSFVPLAGEPSQQLRLRHLRLAPGATIQWHAHDSIEGMALVLSGEVIERRNSCLDPIIYRAGDIAPETLGTAHSWRNESGAEAIILVVHRIPR